MDSFHDWYSKYKDSCTCGRAHEDLPTELFEIGEGVLQKIPAFLEKQQLRRPLLVYDQHTKAAAGDKLEAILTASGLIYEASQLSENAQQDVIADERAILQVLVDASPEIDCMIAVGAGTIHDITRFSSFKMGLPFLSVPTAPSVDGFNSKGAPIVLEKVKKTFQTQAPIGLFADVAILVQAPQSMVAAGFADMLGKYTSLADWKFGRLTAGEPYCDAAAEMTQEALALCVDHSEEIAVRDDAGVQYLLTGLIQSGMAMSLFGHSHPASAAEHHLSHYWEMGFLQEERKQLLHGEKVGVACGIIADHYHEHRQHVLNAVDPAVRPQVEALFEEIPSGKEIRSILQKAGGKTTREELGIEETWVSHGLEEAHHIRDRYTMLRLLNEQK